MSQGCEGNSMAAELLSEMGSSSWELSSELLSRHGLAVLGYAISGVASRSDVLLCVIKD